MTDSEYLLKKADERRLQGRPEHADFLALMAQYFKILDKLDRISDEAFRAGALAQRVRDLAIVHNEFRKEPNNARLAVAGDKISRAVVTRDDELIHIPILGA